MSMTLDTLNKVLTNVQSNRDNITKQIAASTKTLPTDPDVLDAIELLIKTFSGNVQEIGQTIGAKLQIDSMEANLPEFDALIAGLQVVLADEANLEATTALIVSGATASSPLSDAAGNSQPSAADNAAPVEAPTVPAQASDTGDQAGPGAPVNGTITA